MRRIAISQRIDHYPERGEYRDALDIRWYSVATAVDATPLPLPTLSAEQAAPMLQELAADALVLSGGNSLSACDPDAPDASPLRDAWEAALIEAALARNMPILGVCRGMQMLCHHFGGTLERVTGHAGTRHALRHNGAFPYEVNSYHHWGITEAGLPADFIAEAHAPDGTVEAMRHSSLPVYAIMWHPEREVMLQPEDYSQIMRLFP